MDKRAKDKLVRSPRGNGGGQDAQKRSSLKNWKGREEGKRWKEEVERDPQALGMRRWRVGGTQEKMEGHCSTGRNTHWAVVAME